MELELTGKKENKALQRQEVELEIKDVKLMPSRKELKPKIAALLGAKEELTVIESIDHTFGTTSGQIKVHVYENEEAMKKIAPAYLIERDAGKKKKKGEEEKKEEVKEKPAEEKAEKPKEEKKEKKPAEKKAEEKKEGDK